MAEPAALSPLSIPDPVTEALPLLQAKYIDFKGLNYRIGDHLGDLIARSGGRIVLVSLSSPASPPILAVALPNGILYWRLASFTPPTDKTWADLEAQFRTRAPNGIVLDLRSNTAPDDYTGAKQMLSILKAPPLPARPETLDDSRSTPIVFPSPIVAIINGQTSGSAEALVAALKAEGALVIGVPTQGAVAQFEEDKLPSGDVLRFVTGVVPPGNDIPEWGHPVQPDIGIPANDQNERAALTLIRDNHLADVIQELDERHRLNEASLVQGQDPEYDDYLTMLERKPVLLSLPVVHDPVLVSALDSLRAIRLSQRTLPAAPPTGTLIQ